VAALVLAALPACGGGSTPQPALVSARGFPLGDVVVQRGSTTVLHLEVEIADTGAAREKGLMGVQQLTESQGMVFVFPRVHTAQFWMKDTLIPLDIAFWDAANHVVDTQSMTPCAADPCPTYASAQPYLDAVEMTAGLVAKAGVRAGDTVQFSWRAHATSRGGTSPAP
jgi:uncharacterized membrane protein (UPF0127 family)